MQTITTFLERFDTQDRDVSVRYLLWRMKWFPYRSYLGADIKRELQGGPKAKAVWNLPEVTKKKNDRWLVP